MRFAAKPKNANRSTTSTTASKRKLKLKKLKDEHKARSIRGEVFLRKRNMAAFQPPLEGFCRAESTFMPSLWLLEVMTSVPTGIVNLGLV